MKKIEFLNSLYKMNNKLKMSSVNHKEIEQRKVSEQQSINQQIRDYEILLGRTTTSITNLDNNDDIESGFKASQIQKLEVKAKELREKISELELLLEKTKSGRRNKEFEEAILKGKAKSKEVRVQKREKEEKKISKKEFRENEKSIWGRENTVSERDMDKAYKYYLDVSGTLNDHMQHNLKSMTSDKGYIWRGVCFFGEIPSNSKNLTLFGRDRGVMMIHEYISDRYNLYKKEGKKQKVLVSSVPRKNLSH